MHNVRITTTTTKLSDVWSVSSGRASSIPPVGRKSEGRLASIEGMVPDPFNLPPGCVFHPRCPEYMPGKCDRIVPSWTQVEGEDHWARCLLYEEV